MKRRQFAALVTVLLFITYIGAARTEAAPVLESSPNEQTLTQELNLISQYEDNRIFGEQVTIRGVYSLIFLNHYQLRTGLSYNISANEINAIFVEIGYRNIMDSRYSIKLKFLGNQYPEYGKAANSIVPYFHWDGIHTYIDFGINYRYLNATESDLWNIFYYNTPVSEIIPYCRIGYRFTIINGSYLVICEMNNYDDMYAGNLGAYGFFLINEFQIDNRLKLVLNLGFRQAGSIALSATFYKTIISGGIEVQL